MAHKTLQEATTSCDRGGVGPRERRWGERFGQPLMRVSSAGGPMRTGRTRCLYTHDDVLLLLGKRAKPPATRGGLRAVAYSLDYRPPFSCVTALAVALSMFSNVS